MGNAVSRPSCLGQKSRRPEELRREPRDVGMDVGQPPDPSLPQAWPGSLEKPPGVGKGWSPVPAAPRSGVGSPALRRSRSEVTVPNGGTPGVLVGGAAVATWTPPPRAGGPRGTWSWKPLTTREVTEVTEVTETIVTEIVEVTEYPMGEPLVTRTVTVLTELVAGQTDAAEGSPRAVPALEVSGGTEQAQDTLESLLAWVADMEELVGNQKPPSAEVKVAKAQLEEQKLLKRLLEERRPRVERVLQDMEHGVVMEHGLGREHESSTEHGLGMEHGSSTERRSSMEHCLGVEHGSSTEHGSSVEHGSDVAEVSNTGAEHGSDTEHGSGTGHGPSMEHGLDMEHGSGVAHGLDTEHGSGTGHGPNTEHVSDTEPVWAAVPKGLGARWERLVQEAEARSRCLVRIVPAAQDFQEALDPFQEWLVATERQLAQLWHPGGCLDRVRDAHQQSQALCQEIRGRLGQLDVALERGQRVLEMVTGEEAVVAQEKLEALRLRYVLVGQSSSDTEQRLRQTLEASSRLGTAQEDLALWLSHLEKELATRDSQTGGQEMVLSDSDREKFQQVLESQRCRSSGLAQRLEEVGQLQLEPPALRAQLAQQKLLSAEVLLHRGLVERLLGVLEPLLGAWPEPLRQQLQWAVRGLREDTEQLCQRCGAVAARLERAQALLEQFSEAQEELEPWLEEAQELGGQLDPHNMDGQDLKEQQALLQCLREAMAEHRPVLGKLERVVVELLELSPLQAAPLQQRWRAAEERYGALRQRLRRATSLLEDTLPRYSQLSERLSLLLESLERVRSRLSIRPSVRGDAGQLRERLRDTGLALAELEELGGGLESVRSQGGDLVGTLRDAGLDTAATGIEERSGELLSLWGSLRCRCQEQEQWLRDLLALAERFWPGLSELALALGDTQHLVLGLEEPGGDPEEIRARLHTMQALREEVDALQGELDALGSLGVELMSHCGDTDRPDVTRSLDELYSSWHNLNKVWGERCARLEEQLQSALSYREALKRLSGWLEAAELRVTQEGTSLLSGDPEMVQQQLAELKEWRRELYQWRVEVESLRHWGGGGQGEPPAPLRDLQRRWDRLEEDLGSRQHQLEAALLGLGQLRHQLEELLAWLGTTAEQLQRPPDPHPDLQTCEIELAKHKVLRNDVLSHARTVQSVTEVGQGLLVATPGDNLEGLQQDLQQLRQRWDLVQSQTETRQLELENTLSQVQDLSLEMTELLQWLEQVELQLCLAPPGWGPPETTKEELATHLELCRALDARQETFGGLRDRLQRLLPPAHAAQPCSTQHTLRLLEHKWSSVQAQAQHRKERLSEGLRLSTEFHGTAQELLRWLTRAEEILGSPEPPSVLLDVVTTQIQEHKALEQEMVAHGEQLSGLEAMAAQLRDFSRKQDGAVTQTLVVSVRERLGKVQQRAAERGAALEEGRKRSKEFMESRRLLLEWMAAVEPGLAEPPEAAGTREEIKGQLAQHKAFQRLLRAKRPMYEATVRSGRALREAAQSPRDRPPLEELLGELKEKWDGMWSRAAERQQKLEENLLFSGKMTEALQALMDWLYWAEPQLSEDVPVGGDRDLVGDLMDKHKVFQKELGKRAGSVRMLQRWVRDPGRGGGSGVPDSQWLQQQVEELGARWDLVCSLSLGKQERLEAALRQAEEFHRLVQSFLGRLGESERNLRVWGCPEEEAAAQEGQRQLQEVLESLECQQLELECISWLGEEILTTSHPDAVLTIRSWLTVVKSRFQEVQSWAQHQSERLRAQAAAMAAEREERTRLLEWMGAAEEALGLRDQEPLPQEAEALEELSTQHAVFMEELNRKQPDVEKVTKSGKQKLPTELGPPAARRLATRRRSSGKAPGVPPGVVLGGVEPQPPVLAQVLQRWQQLWLLALDRQYRLETALRRLRELEEFAHFDFGVWRRRYVQWIGQMKSRVLDVFRGIDRDQDGRISQQEFIQGVLASKFPTNVLEMNAVATIFDVNGDGFIDYYEFISTLHPHRDPLRRSADAERIQDEVNRQVAQCNCAKRFQVEQISANRYRFGESQQLRMVRILRSTLMVRVGGGWIALDEFLVKNDPCRVKGRTNLKINEKYLSPETPGATKCAGTPSSPSSKPLSPSRSSSSLSLYTSASAPSSPLARKSVLRRTRSGDRCPRPRGSPLPDGAELQPPAAEETPAPAPPEPPEGSPPEHCSPCR